MHCLETKNGVIAVENSMIVSQKIKDRITVRSSTSEYIPRKIESRVLMGYLYIHVHDSITDNSQKMQLKCPSLNEWVNKMWCEQTVEHYSPLKWKEILTPVTTWLNLEDIMLSEISHSGHLRRQIFRKLRSWHPVPSLHANRWGNNGNIERLKKMFFSS